MLLRSTSNALKDAWQDIPNGLSGLWIEVVNIRISDDDRLDKIVQVGEGTPVLGKQLWMCGVRWFWDLYMIISYNYWFCEIVVYLPNPSHLWPPVRYVQP